MDPIVIYTIPQAAKVLHISSNYAYALARDGTLPSITIGRRRLIPERMLQTWINKLSVEYGAVNV